MAGKRTSSVWVRPRTTVIAVAICSAILGSVASAATFSGLGDLPGGAFLSQAKGVSADGAIISGVGISENGWEAFRWTKASGLEPLGDLPGGRFESFGSGISDDGSVVVGRSRSGREQEAFYWTSDAGMIGLGSLLWGRCL